MPSFKYESYPPPEVPASWPSTSLRPLLPIHPPPPSLLQPLQKPSLPSPPRQPLFSSSVASKYNLSTHIIPSCYLRTTPYTPEPQPIGEGSTKKERQDWAKGVLETFERRKIESGKTGYEQPRLLWNCLNRYVKKDIGAHGSKGVTLFFAHANGFPKEIWEPTLNHLLNSQAGTTIDEIWTWEAVQHGDSCLLNKDTLGSNFDWLDGTRDILNFLLHFLPSTTSVSSLPTHLPQIPPSESESRKTHGFKNRQFICIGHSLGGCLSTLAALTQPQLFSSLLLIDPVLIGFNPETAALSREAANALVNGALIRRESWPSRQAALELLSQSPFFGAWDKDVLRVYVECGMYTVTVPGQKEEKEVRLKMSGMQEAIVFVEKHTRAEVYAHVPKLDEKIRLRWVMPKAGGLGPAGWVGKRVWLRPKNSGNVKLPDTGHLVAQENPQLLAEYLAGFIEENYRTSEVPKAML